MTDRAALIAKLEAATGGSRELSDEILRFRGWTSRGSPAVLWFAPNKQSWKKGRPDPTRSIDDALALHRLTDLGWRGLLESAIIVLPQLHPEGPLTQDMLACVVCSIALKAQEQPT